MLCSEFIPCMDKLFDESILIGSGYTARETLRYDGKAGAGAGDLALCQERLHECGLGPFLSRLIESCRKFRKRLGLLYVPWLNPASRCLDLHCKVELCD